MKTLAVLGCGGFIGSHLLDRLLANKNVRVEGWDPEYSKIADHLLNPNFQHHPYSITDAATQGELTKAIVEADAVINLAAICNPSEYNTRPLQVIQSNLFDLLNVVKLCAAHRKWLISFSTSEVYGRTLASYVSDNYEDRRLYELDEDTTPLIMGPISNQRWTYACAKQMIERLIYANHKEYGMPFTIIRPLNFFGPRMDYIPGRDGEGLPRVLACFMAALLDNKPMQLVDGGGARRTIISIHEALDVLLLMLENPDKAMNQIFNIGNPDNEVTIAELADLMRKIYARITGDATYENHPIEITRSEDFYGEGYEDCDRRMPKIDKARELLGWSPRISLEETLYETMLYYHERYVEAPATSPLLTYQHITL